MSHNRRTYSIALKGWGFWLAILVSALLLRLTGLGWLAAGLGVLLLSLLALPVLVLLGFRWWMRHLLAHDACPICEFESQAIEGQQFECPNCQVPLYVADGQFYRQTPAGTIDVEFSQE